ALLLISLAIGVGLSELILRLRIGAPPSWTFPQEYYVTDAEMGFRLQPNQRAFTHDRPVEINSIGLRDRDYLRDPGRDTRRWIALGDSETFGNGLALAETWPKQLEQQLREDLGSRWEVVNGGIPGSATWQQEILLRRISDTYEFDGFVVGVYVN